MSKSRKVWGYRLHLNRHGKGDGTAEMVFRRYTPMETKINGYSIWYVADPDVVCYEDGERKRLYSITDPLTGMQICSIKAKNVLEMQLEFYEDWLDMYAENMEHPSDLYASAQRKFASIRKYLDGYEDPNKHDLCEPDTEIPFEMNWETLSVHYHGGNN